MTESAFGALLRSFRHAAEMTLEQLADASGVSARAISDMERGHSRAPQRRTLAALAEALRLSPAQRRQLALTADEGRSRNAGPAGTCEPPRAVPDFVGRSEQLDRLRRLCAGATTGGPAPVVVIHGPAGVGKSSLAVHAAHQLRDLLPDGAFFLDLRGFDASPVQPADGLARLLSAFGTDPRRTASDLTERSAQFRAALRDRRGVVILDNSGSEPQVRPLLAGAGASLVIITSRRALSGLTDVLRIPLAPFSVAESADLLRGLVGQHSDRISEPAVERVAQLCENLPLALRIAGQRLLSRPGWTMSHLAARLSDTDRRLATLTAGDLAVEGAFGLSYAQLSASARRTFRRISLIPAGDFGAPLAAILAQCSVPAAEDELNDLVDLGLLTADHADRYRFHDLIRLYAHARLQSEEPDSDRRATHDRMVRWLLETVIAAGQWFEAGDDPVPADRPGAIRFDSADAAQRWLEAESVNWMAALRIAAAAGQHRLVVRVAEAMHWYSDRTVHSGRWTEVYRMSRDAAAELDDERLAITHLNYHAWALSVCAGRHEESLAAALAAYEIACRLGDPAQQAWALMYSTAARRRLGDSERALAELRTAAELCDAAGDHDGFLQASLGTAHVLADLNRPAEAREVYTGVLAAVRDRPLKPTVAVFSRAMALLANGYLLVAEGHWAQARNSLAEALPALEEFTEPVLLGRGHYWMARVEQHAGALDRARTHVRRALELYDSVGHEENVAPALELLTQLDR